MCGPGLEMNPTKMDRGTPAIENSVTTRYALDSGSPKMEEKMRKMATLGRISLFLLVLPVLFFSISTGVDIKRWTFFCRPFVGQHFSISHFIRNKHGKKEIKERKRVERNGK